MDVDDWSNNEIRDKFVELGHPVVPVTPTTRRTLVKKLKKLLEESVDEGSFVEERQEPRLSRRSVPTPGRTRSPGRPRKSPSRTNTTLPAPSRKSPSRSPSLELNDYEFVQPRQQVPSSIVSPRPTGFFTSTERPSGLFSSTERPSGLFTSTERSSLFSSTERPSGLYSSSDRPFQSEFMKRLTANSPSQRADPLPVSTSFMSKLDIKESDDEDSGPTPIFVKFSQGAFKGFDTSHSKGNGRILSSEGWFSLDSPISAVLLFIFLAFFSFIGITYINMHFVDTNVALNSELMYFPPCLNSGNPRPGENCISEKDKEATYNLFMIFFANISEQLANKPCMASQAPISYKDEDVVALALLKDKTRSIYSFDRDIKNLKVLVDHNPKCRIKATVDGFLLEQPPTSYYCIFVNSLLQAVNYSLKIALVLALLFTVYKLIKWWLRKEARHKEEVYKLVGSIVELLSSKSLGPESCIPIIHVKDQLIPPQDRTRKAKLWEDAVELLETDSRVRREVQEVEGEEFFVWRWLASTSLSPNKRKMWQGQAFDTMEGSVNSLQHSPTPCLKIRHMFDAEQEEGETWVTTVVDAILEKCGKAKILHVVVDRKSREGCVYIKCASTLDAGIAYRSLHGSWFDSNLVTVKYVREKRYLERFPDSAKCTKPLQLSTTKVQ